MSSKIITEYKQRSKFPSKAHEEVDLIQGRVLYSILDQIENMKNCGLKDKEIKGLILRDVNEILDMEFEELAWLK